MLRAGARGVAACVAGLLALAGCGFTGDAVQGRELRVGIQFAPKAGFAIDTDDAFVLSQLGVTETLVVANPDGSVAPGLAVSWQRDDPRTWRFRLREKVRFQNGEPLTGQAVATALTHALSSPTPPRGLTGLTATASGPLEVLLRTQAPDPVLPQRLASPNTAILAPAAYRSGQRPEVVRTGTGPFQITAQQPGQGVTLARFDGYWGKHPALDRVRVRFIKDAQARVAALRAGELDLVQGVPISQLPVLKGLDGVRVQSYEVPRVTSLYMNMSAAPFADRRVREAVAAAIDRRLLAETVFSGSAKPAAQVFGPILPWVPEAAPPGADPERAARLLREAGYSALKVRLWTYHERPELPELATAIQGMLAKAGIKVETRVADYATLEGDVLAGRYDLFLLSRSYLTDVNDLAGFLASDFGCQGAYNLNRYCSAELDELVAELRNIEDLRQRQAAFARAAALLARDVAGLPLVHEQARVAMSTRVTGFQPDPLGHRLVTPDLAVSG